MPRDREQQEALDDDDQGIEVTDEEWAALMEAAESVRQGKLVDSQAVLAALARHRAQ